MTSNRPYLLRAVYEWILDNNCTPYVLVNAGWVGVDVPEEHIKDGQIVLNISPTAVQSLLISNDAIEFDGRFSGISRSVYVPAAAVMGIYARENGQGMIFEPEGLKPNPTDPDGSGDTPEPGGSGGSAGAGKGSEKGSGKKPSLRVVK